MKEKLRRFSYTEGDRPVVYVVGRKACKGLVTISSIEHSCIENISIVKIYVVDADKNETLWQTIEIYPNGNVSVYEQDFTKIIECGK